MNHQSGRVVIGLGYRARSGKDTIADFLVKHFGFTKMAFAEPLKEAAKVIFGWSDRHVYGDLKEVEDEFWGFTPRWALQKLGTECVRDVIGKDTWQKACARRIQACTTPVAITDVRFPEEARMVRALGGELWLVNRPSLSKPTTDLHVSESAMSAWGAWDRVIANDKDLVDLERVVIEAVTEILTIKKVGKKVEKKDG